MRSFYFANIDPPFLLMPCCGGAIVFKGSDKLDDWTFNLPVETEKLLVHELPESFTSAEIYPLNDLHTGDSKTDIPLFRKFIKYILAQPNRYLMFIGDMMNNAIKTSVSNVYNETMNPHEQKKWLIQELKPVADRFLCFVPGNHEERSTKDVDAHLVEDIAMNLGKDKLYKHDGAFIKVTLGRHVAGNQKRIAYTLCGIHGRGGGKKSGGALNNLEDFAVTIDGLDIIVMGHVHRKLGSRPQKLVIDPRNDVVIQRDFLCVIAAPWQMYGGYAFRGMMRPGTRGATPIILSGKEKDFYTMI